MCVCVGEIISLQWFSKELKNDLSKNNCFRGVILIRGVQKNGSTEKIEKTEEKLTEKTELR